MFYFKNFFLSFLILSSLFASKAFANNEIINYLKEGSKIVFIRHAIAPGNGCLLYTSDAADE